MIQKLFIFFILPTVYTGLVNAQSDKLKLVDEFVSPANVELYSLQSMDVYENNMVLVNNYFNAVHFDGERWLKLDPEVCFPGFQFRPREARFNNESGELFISNSWGIWGFRFGKGGECLGGAHKSFSAPTTFISNEDLFGLVIGSNDTNILQWNLEGEFMDTVFTYENEYPNSVYNFEGGGIVKSGEDLFFINSTESSLNKINLTTGFYKNIELESDNLNYTRNDIKASITTPNDVKDILNFSNKHSTNAQLYDFSEDYLLLQSFPPKERKSYGYIHLISKESLEIENEIEIEGWLVLAKSNKLYFAEDLETELPQVKISVFELK